MNHKEQIKLEPDFSKMRRNVRMSLSNGVGEDFRCFDIETCMNWGEIMLLVSVLVGKDEQQ